MHRRSVISTGSAALALLAAYPSAAQSEAAPVVLELFTSEGCSSCPAADALLGEMAHRPEVVALAWHVDYWNNLGWQDPYSSLEWTRRQRQYAQALNQEVYTPALVVNGKRMVVGSDRSAVRAAINEPHMFLVGVGLERSVTGLVARIGPRPDAAIVSLIVYDAVHATSIGAGENAGRSLRETRIVRTRTTLELGAQALTLNLQDTAREQGAVLLVQGRDLAVLGVAQVRPASANQP